MFKSIAWLGACLVSTLCMVASVAIAHDVQTEAMRIAHPFATPTPPGASNGAAYVAITAFSTPVTLVGASSPASSAVELHEMRMDGDMMQMRHVNEIRVEAGETITMRPGGGFHLMLVALTEPLADGDRFPLTLSFAEHEEVTMEVWVQSTQEGGNAAEQHHHH
jgi:copper(I)-binding protein